MRFNKKKITLLIVLFIFTWVVDIALFKSHDLQGLLFMKHYYELSSNGVLELYYLENSRASNNIQDIRFSEIDANIPFRIAEVDSNKYYNLKKIQVILSEISLKDDNGSDIPLQKALEGKKDMLLTKIQVSTREDSNSIVDIGKVYLKYYEVKESNLIFSKSDSSAGDRGDSTLRLTEDIKVAEVSSRYMDILEKQAKLTISKVPLGEIKYPFEVKQENDLYTSYTFQFNEEDIQRNYYYNINLAIEGEGLSGDKLETYVNVNYLPYNIDNIDVKSLHKKSREE